MKVIAQEPWQFEGPGPQVMFAAGQWYGDRVVHVPFVRLTPEQARKAADEWPVILRHMADIAEKGS